MEPVGKGSFELVRWPNGDLLGGGMAATLTQMTIAAISIEQSAL